MTPPIEPDKVTSLAMALDVLLCRVYDSTNPKDVGQARIKIVEWFQEERHKAEIEGRIDEVVRMSSRWSTITDWTEQGIKLLPTYLGERFEALKQEGEK